VLVALGTIPSLSDGDVRCVVRLELASTAVLIPLVSYRANTAAFVHNGPCTPPPNTRATNCQLRRQLARLLEMLKDLDPDGPGNLLAYAEKQRACMEREVADRAATAAR